MNGTIVKESKKRRVWGEKKAFKNTQRKKENLIMDNYNESMTGRKA